MPRIRKMKRVEPTLSIFETFKTKRDELTGEALRQRSIIAHLATNENSASRTRTAISQRIAEENGVIWKNIYSGIFRDLDEILIPMGIVKEAGRLPLKRGPKALQEKGIPFYELTTEGLIVALSLSEIFGREEILKKFLTDSNFEQPGIKEIFLKLSETVPRFTYSLFEKYVRAFTEGKIEKLMPFSLENLKRISDESILIQKEFLEAFSESSKLDREKIIEFLRELG